MNERSDGLPVLFQRLESATVAALAVVIFVDLDFAWWWPVVLFLPFDASMIATPATRGWVHGSTTRSTATSDRRRSVWSASPGRARWAAFLAPIWVFHIAVDRLLGYGLKFGDRFAHTHLGEIGRPKP